MSGAARRVCAVVVTYDRAATAVACTDAVLAQTRPPERLVVVDNGSRRPEAERLAAHAAGEPRIELLRLAENLGPAGGFAAGIERAVADGGCTDVWACDDDAVPHADCLERLLAAAAEGNKEILFPTIRDSTGRDTRYPGWSAVLIAAAAVRRGGLPDARLFWWTEDTEYLQWRLPRLHGAAVRFVDGAVVEHGSPRPPRKPAWKYYYEVRNTLHYRLRVQRGKRRRRASRLLAVVGRSLARVILREDRKLAKLAAIGRGLADGLAGRLGKRVDPAREAGR